MTSFSVPPIEVDAKELSVGGAIEAVVAALQGAIDRGTPFTAVVRAPAVPTRGIRLAEMAHGTRMLKALRSDLRASCRGLAFVVDERTLARYGKVIGSADKAWGCRTMVGADVDVARAWAGSRIR